MCSSSVVSAAGSVQRRPGALDLRQLLLDALAGAIDRFADRFKLLQRCAGPVLLQPQTLAQHFLQGLLHWVVVVTGNRLDLGAGDAQPRFQCVGGIKHAGHGAIATTERAAP